MASTKAQIVDKAASKLGLKTGTLNLQADIETDLSKAYDEVWKTLDRINLVDWDSSESVPDEYVNPVVDLVAWERADDYQVSTERYSRLQLRAASAQARIREVLNPYTYKPAKTVYF